MTLPGHEIIRREKPLNGDLVGSTGTWFVVGQTERGSVTAFNEAFSMAEFELKGGGRAGYTTMYDAVETFFREGGKRLVWGRVVGTTPVLATANLFDAAGVAVPADVALVVNAKNPGAWGNSLRVSVEAGDNAGEFKIRTTHATDTSINELSPSLVDRDAAVAWSQTSAYIDLVLGASNEDPRVVANTALTTGTEDAGTVADAHWLAALNRLPRVLGPGQVSAPGVTTSVRHGQLLDHAAANNRVALLDLASTPTVATLTAAAATNRGHVNARYGGHFAPWATVPGIAGGTVRTVPYSAVQAGIIARGESVGGLSPGDANAGVNGQAQYAIGLAQPAWTDAEREQLHNAGVNVARVINGVVKTYGYRSTVNGATDPNWLQLNWVRLYMELVAKGDAVLDSYDFRTIDGRGLLRSEVNSRLTAMLLPYYRKGVLFGKTPQEAFAVDTSEAINPIPNLADGLLTAAFEVRMSPHAERVRLYATKTPITEVIS